MGFYTHVETDMTLRADAPTEVVDLLLWMAGVSPAHWDEKLIEPRYPGPLPDADLFRTERWSLMLTCSYAGHSATRSWDPVTRRLRTSSSFKNYGNEIEKFSRWVLPYLAGLDLRSLQHLPPRLLRRRRGRPTPLHRQPEIKP